MALGQTYDNNKEAYRPTVYGLSMSNTSEDAVEKSQLSFSMWKGTIKIQIAPMTKAESDEYAKADRDSAGCIYLNHSKAQMLSELILGFMKSPKDYNGWSVFAGGGLITITDGKDIGAKNPCLVIRSINKDTGAVEFSYAYEFKNDYHTVVTDFNEKTSDYTNNTEMFASLEMEEVAHQLADYARFSNRAAAFATVDAMQYQVNSVKNDLYKIAEKVGASLGTGKQRSGGRSFFDKGAKDGESTTHKSKTIQEIYES